MLNPATLSPAELRAVRGWLRTLRRTNCRPVHMARTSGGAWRIIHTDRSGRLGAVEVTSAAPDPDSGSPRAGIMPLHHTVALMDEVIVKTFRRREPAGGETGGPGSPGAGGQAASLPAEPMHERRRCQFAIAALFSRHLALYQRFLNMQRDLSAWEAHVSGAERSQPDLLLSAGAMGPAEAKALEREAAAMARELAEYNQLFKRLREVSSKSGSRSREKRAKQRSPAVGTLL